MADEIQPIKQDLWRAGTDLIVVPTNSTLDKCDRLIMGAGVALQARRRYSTLAEKAGSMILMLNQTSGHSNYLFLRIRVSHHVEIGLLQTKTDWRLPSPENLVRKSLQAMHSSILDNDIKTIAMPLPGAGHGGLPKEVSLRLVNEELGDFADKIVLCEI